MKVLAAIVTYNRARLLERCVDHVQRQTRPADEIVVINNGSTDDTEEMLRGHAVRCITQANVGGAGGFKRAIETALTEGFDAVWVMDDDGFPDLAALAKLVCAFTDETACLSSVVLREDDPEHFVFPYPVLSRVGTPAIFAWPRKLKRMSELRDAAADTFYPFAHLFNGALIATAAVRQIGNVEPGFFIYGDEVDYQMRLRSAGHVLSHLDAHHFHPDVASRPLNDVKLYYYVKNTIILNRRYLDRARLRSLLTVAAGLARMAARNGIGEALSYILGSRRAVLRTAISRGLKGQIGNDFNV